MKLTNKIKKLFIRQRDAPRAVGIVTQTDWDLLFAGGYVPLYSCPEVAMCVDAIADLVSNMTLRLMRNTDTGDVRVVNGLSRAIDIMPNAYQNRKAFVYNIVSTLLTVGNGNCVVVPRFDADGNLLSLMPARPPSVMFDDLPDGGYKIRVGQTVYSPDEILHFAINPDPERPWIGRGRSVSLSSIVDCINQANATKTALQKSPAPSIVMKVDGLTEDLSTRDGRQKMIDRFVDSNDRGVPWIIPAETMELQQIKPLTVSDLAIKENLELDIKRIAGIYRVPAFMVGVGDFNRDEYDNFITTTVMSIAQVIEQELTRKLLYSPDYHITFNPRSLHSYSITELVSAGKELVDRMAMRRNEWRDWLGLSPDEDMEDLLALENYIPADRLGDQKKLKGEGDNADE
nr:MAG TPA: portal protein [Caudoviricetes sp.]